MPVDKLGFVFRQFHDASGGRQWHAAAHTARLVERIERLRLVWRPHLSTGSNGSNGCAAGGGPTRALVGQRDGMDVY
jgi:hypothetical protein